MSNSARLIAVALTAFFCATPAEALSLVTFVSGNGVNTGTCATPVSACRTFQYALTQTAAGGEIKALDPANYSPVAINKSISITGVEGASIFKSSPGNAIIINAGANGVVSLSNLTLDGFNRGGSYGVLLTSAGSLTIRNCVARNFANDGISLQPAGSLTFLISQSVMTDNGASGVYVSSAGKIRGDLDHITATRNVNGVWISSGVTIPFTEVSIAESTISNNANNGITAAGGIGPVLHIGGSTVRLNTYGVKVNAGQANSAGNNAITANVIDISPAGALNYIGTQ